jgi:hypothetical protein
VTAVKQSKSNLSSQGPLLVTTPTCGTALAAGACTRRIRVRELRERETTSERPPSAFLRFLLNSSELLLAAPAPPATCRTTDSNI